jgi:hypothetical protein
MEKETWEEIMCNKLHEDSIPIKEEGIGYKLFTEEKGRYKPFFVCSWMGRTRYNFDSDNSCVWNGEQDHGFAFFLSEKDVSPHYVKFLTRISYKGGMGSHVEPSMAYYCKGKPIIALCKEFTIVEE